MPKRETIPPQAAWPYAMAALMNAQSLLAAARVLFASNHFGPALSLAVSAREETAKFVFAMLSATQQRPAELMSTRVHDHRPKQALGRVLSAFAVAAKDVSFRLPTADSLPDSIDEEGLRDLVSRVDTASLDTIDLATLQSAEFEQNVNAVSAGADERLRQRGLYVDAVLMDGNWSVATPASISREQAAEEIEHSAVVLDPIHALIGPPSAEEADSPSPADIEMMRQLVVRILAESPPAA